ncbi:MAG: class I SAM-dependent methyltransferase [Bdellovibrionales bacterium]|nr:class I SAM-dependent methyltransferase [Bdellovibrionales bacterium]
MNTISDDSENSVLSLPLSEDVKRAFKLYREAVSAVELEVLERYAGQQVNIFAESKHLLEKRIKIPMRAVRQLTQGIFEWIFESRTTHNFPCNLTPDNKACLEHFVSHIVNRPVVEIRSYISEIENDAGLARHIVDTINNSKQRAYSDPVARFGRRLGWYALVRALKPRVVVETGVDRGLGSVVFTSALMRNSAEGHPGYYYGLEIDQKCGLLFTAPYSEYGEIIYGDSLETLMQIEKPIDFFIHDSNHSLEHERRELEVIQRKLADNAILLSDNGPRVLMEFAEKTGRKFYYFKEITQEYWHGGADIAVATNK